MALMKNQKIIPEPLESESVEEKKSSICLKSLSSSSSSSSTTCSDTEENSGEIQSDGAVQLKFPLKSPTGFHSHKMEEKKNSTNRPLIEIIDEHSSRPSDGQGDFFKANGTLEKMNELKSKEQVVPDHKRDGKLKINILEHGEKIVKAKDQHFIQESNPSNNQLSLSLENNDLDRKTDNYLQSHFVRESMPMVQSLEMQLALQK